jgi:hypothetical protein
MAASLLAPVRTWHPGSKQGQSIDTNAIADTKHTLNYDRGSVVDSTCVRPREERYRGYSASGGAPQPTRTRARALSHTQTHTRARARAHTRTHTRTHTTHTRTHTTHARTQARTHLGARTADPPVPAHAPFAPARRNEQRGQSPVADT